jgi:hypothetical protein
MIYCRMAKLRKRPEIPVGSSSRQDTRIPDSLRVSLVCRGHRRSKLDAVD